MGLPFAIGERVVHVLTKGRIRGVVQAIRVDRERTMYRVLVDRLGRDFDYDAANLAPEAVWDRSLATLGRGNEGQGTQ